MIPSAFVALPVQDAPDQSPQPHNCQVDINDKAKITPVLFSKANAKVVVQTYERKMKPPVRQHRELEPLLFAVSALAKSNGPEPAITMRSFLTGVPALIKACKPPAPVTPGKVQPGKGKNSSLAPVHNIS